MAGALRVCSWRGDSTACLSVRHDRWLTLHEFCFSSCVVCVLSLQAKAPGGGAHFQGSIAEKHTTDAC